MATPALVKHGRQATRLLLETFDARADVSQFNDAIIKAFEQSFFQ
jgi:hypothetical protein